MTQILHQSLSKWKPCIIHPICYNPEKMFTNKKNLKFSFISTLTFFLITANFTAEKTKKVEKVHTMLTGRRTGTESIFFTWSPVFFPAEQSCPTPWNTFTLKWAASRGGVYVQVPQRELLALLNVLQNYILIPL